MLKKLILGVVLLLILAAGALALIAHRMLSSDAVRAAVEEQLTARLGQPVTIGSAGASIYPRAALELHDVRIGQPLTVTLADVSIATGLRGLFSRRIEDASVIVSGSRITLPVAFGIMGAATGAGSADRTAAGLTIVSIRTLAFRDVELIVGPQSMTIDLESSLDGGRLEVSSFSARSGDTRIEATGVLTSIERLEGSFKAAGDPLDLDALLALLAGLSRTEKRDGRAGGSSPPMPVKLRVDMKAPRGRLAGYPFTDLASTADILAGRVHLEPLALGMFGGRLEGRMDVAASGDTPTMRLAGRVDGMDVTEVLKAASASQSITGRLSGSIAFSSRGADAQALLEAASGTADVAITNGVVPGLEMVRTVVLAFGKPSGAPPPGSGSAFTRLGGAFTLADRVIRSNNIAFASRDFDMTGRATVAMRSGALNMHADVVLSEELTAQAGTDLRRYAQENRRVVLPATITGTVAQPVIALDLAAAMSRALQNELKRKVQSLLEGLFKKKG